MENRAEAGDRATVVVVLIALPLLLLSAVILVAALAGPRRHPTPANESVTPQSVREAPAKQASDVAPMPAVNSKPTEDVREEKASEAPFPAPPVEKSAAAVRLAAGPLADLYDREAYNALRELKALVDSQAWAEAARTVLAFDSAKSQALAPWISDSSLAVTLPLAARLAHAEYPQLRQALGLQYETLANLRVAEAIRAGDAVAVELVTAQFPASRAVADAHVWLADEAVTSGRFSRAVNHYRVALSMDVELQGEVGPRMRLAAAMLGQDVGQPTTSDVKLGETSVAAAEFEALIAEMRERAEADGGLRKGSEVHPPAAGVSRFGWRVRHTIENFLAVGNQKERSSPRVQATAAGDIAYFASAAQVAAYDLAQQRLVWRSELIGTKHGRAAEAGFQVTRPVVRGGRVFARLLVDQERRLCCYKAESGALLWSASTREGETIVAGPVLLAGRLVSLCAPKRANGRRPLTLCFFDLQSGEVVSEREIVQLGDDWKERDCSVAADETGVIAAIGGLTVGICDTGEVEWIRSRAGPDTPRLADGQLAGIAGDAAVMINGMSVERIAISDGKVMWRHIGGELAAPPVVGNDAVLVVEHKEGDLRLAWHRADDGVVLATGKAGDLGAQERVEVVLPFGKRLFALVGRERGQDLDIVELEAARDAAESRF